MLSQKEKELIKEYISKNSSFTLIDLCNYLIDHGSSSSTYLTGKYKIYPYAAIFIESYLPQPMVDIKHSENNVHYKIIGELSNQAEDNNDVLKEKKEEEHKQTKEESPIPESQQLSLF
ncbi:hypothetical protein ACJ2A9_19210 [Anaerobacillus sp. MEB173]|uniref:hypothetical protein n=1 Tax=Anaerobacillus sp. MEB173 TaxID=3383345 RepID=UPI003F936C51